MGANLFYGARPRTFLTLVLENQEDSDTGPSDDDDNIEDYQSTKSKGDKVLFF